MGLGQYFMEVLNMSKRKKDPSKIGFSSPQVKGKEQQQLKQDRLKLHLLEKNKNDH